MLKIYKYLSNVTFSCIFFIVTDIYIYNFLEYNLDYSDQVL